MYIHRLAITVSTFLVSSLLGSVCLGQTTVRVSVDSQDRQVKHASKQAAISADGRFVVFESLSFSLVAGDTNGYLDVFLHDRQTGVTERVSVDTQGVQAYGISTEPVVSADGRYVAFSSDASNLVAGDANDQKDVFVHDRQTGVTKRVSVDSLGAEGNRYSRVPSISQNGRFVAFESLATNLVPGDTNGSGDIFVHDCQTGVTERVNVSSQGAEGNGWVYSSSSLSANGRYVAFSSDASNLVAGDTNGQEDVFVHDRQIGVTKRLSVGSQGLEGNAPSFNPSISADGRYVAFESQATNFAAGSRGIFVHDQQTGVIELVSVDSQGTHGDGYSYKPAISADGNHVTFSSSALHLVPGETGLMHDIFVHDRPSGVTERVSVNSEGVQSSLNSAEPSISANGRHIVFFSLASNLVPGDTNGAEDIFVHDRWDGLGANSIYLVGPATASVAAPLELSWATARPNSHYWLAYSMNDSGSFAGGHRVDIGLPHMLLATGVNSGSGTGLFSSPSVPVGAAGLTVYFELLARDTGGILYDSNMLAIAFY